MEKVILLRYGELWLKGNNQKFFENTLIANIKDVLNKYECKFKKAQARYFIEEYNEADELRIIDDVKCIFGLHSLSVAIKVKNDIKLIEDAALSLMEKSGSFRVTCKRADKTFLNSSAEIAKSIGGYLLQKIGDSVNVDLHNPDFTIFVDIRENGFTYVYKNNILCHGGLPVGTAGHGLLLLSGGIDSPVAGYQMAKRGMRISAIHFAAPPYTSDNAKQKVIDLATKISKFTGKIDLFIVPFTKMQLAIHKYCDKDFTITIMRRVMVKIAKQLAEKIGAGALITGESLGQVASQTLESITSTQDSAENMLIFRPLISFDKLDTIEIANKIDTYDISIQNYEDCCTIFLPKNPVIKPKLYKVREEENKIQNKDELIQEIMQTLELIKIG